MGHGRGAHEPSMVGRRRRDCQRRGRPDEAQAIERSLFAAESGTRRLQIVPQAYVAYNVALQSVAQGGITHMPQLPPYHCNPQSAHALLGPIEASVRELAARARHYEERMRFVSDADRTAIAAAQRALDTAAQHIADLTAGAARSRV